MGKSILVTCFLLVMVVSEMANAEQPSLLAAKYLKQASIREKYACVIFCESTEDHRNSLDRSSYIETWYIHAFDLERKVHRHDEFIQTMLSGAGVSTSPSHRLTTVYFEGAKALQWNGTSITKHDLKPDEGEEQFKTLFSQSYFEPLTPTVIGHRAFERHKGPRLSSHMGDLFSIYRWVEEEEFNHGVAQVFSTRNPELFDKLYFDDRYGDMLVLLRRTIGKNGKHFEQITTKWAEINGRWYPSVVEIKKDSTAKTSRKLWYYWMFEGFPSNLFPDGPDGKTDVIHSRELKELIVKKSGGPVR
jgi:hypothetical protein